VEIKWCIIFLEVCLFHVDGKLLVENGFACFLLELVRNFLILLVISSCFVDILVLTLGGLKGLTPSTKSIIIVVG
jgi:hypothetical protein